MSTSRSAGGSPQSLTIVYTVDGSDHYAVIPYPKSYEEALTAAVQRFSQYFESAKPTRQVWLAKGLRTRRGRWIWAEFEPETFMKSIEESAAEIRLCDNEQDGFESDDSDYLSVIISEEDEGQSVHTNMTSILHEMDGKSANSSTTTLSYSPSPAAIAQTLIDDAIHIYHSTTDFPTAISKFEHAASVVPASHPDLKAQCYLHLGYLAQASCGFPPSPTCAFFPYGQSSVPSSPCSPTMPTSLSTARSHFRHAHKLFTQSNNRTGQLKCKQGVAAIALDEHDWDSARSQILFILEAAKRDGVEVDEVWCWSALALVALKQGVPGEADACWGKAWSAGAR